MQARIVKMWNRGVEIDRRVLRDAAGTRGQLVVQDITDQGRHRPAKVARLLQGELQRAELKDVQLVWLSEGRMTLTGYEQIENERGQLIEYRQSWLVMFDTTSATPELSKRNVSVNA
jgi:hypothetical protein